MVMAIFTENITCVIRTPKSVYQ